MIDEKNYHHAMFLLGAWTGFADKLIQSHRYATSEDREQLKELKQQTFDLVYGKKDGTKNT